MAVVLLLALIWAVVLVPPALRVQAAREEAFLLSIGSTSDAPEPGRPSVVPSLRVQRRRRIAGGMLVAMAVTLVGGLLPTFRVLLVVHLFLVDSFIAYIALLAYWADRAAAPAVQAVPAPRQPARRRGWNRERRPAPAVLPDLASLGQALKWGL
jgi:predicted lipid-binding transport protein (Tim44 family)